MRVNKSIKIPTQNTILKLTYECVIETLTYKAVVHFFIHLLSSLQRQWQRRSIILKNNTHHPENFTLECSHLRLLAFFAALEATELEAAAAAAKQETILF